MTTAILGFGLLEPLFVERVVESLDGVAGVNDEDCIPKDTKEEAPEDVALLTLRCRPTVSAATVGRFFVGLARKVCRFLEDSSALNPKRHAPARVSSVCRTPRLFLRLALLSLMLACVSLVLCAEVG